MSGLSKIYYKGKEILYADYRGLNEAECIDLERKLESAVLKDNKPHLQLINVTGGFGTPAYMKVANEVGKNIKHLILKGGIVGIKGVKKVLLMSYNVLVGGKLKPFNSEDEAKEYLVKD